MFRPKRGALPLCTGGPVVVLERPSAGGSRPGRNRSSGRLRFRWLPRSEDREFERCSNRDGGDSVSEVRSMTGKCGSGDGDMELEGEDEDEGEWLELSVAIVGLLKSRPSPAKRAGGVREGLLLRPRRGEKGVPLVLTVVRGRCQGLVLGLCDREI